MEVTMFETCSMKRQILAALAASFPAHAAVKTNVLVHGAFADGSGWKPVAVTQFELSNSLRRASKPTRLRRGAF
jgi:hypothetical protein